MNTDTTNIDINNFSLKAPCLKGSMYLLVYREKLSVPHPKERCVLGVKVKDIIGLLCEGCNFFCWFFFFWLYPWHTEVSQARD